jgi:hypothetical protein
VTCPSGAPAALLRRAGLQPEGPVLWGSPAPTRKSGIYIVERPAARKVAPIALNAVRARIRRVQTITIDGSPATGTALAARLAAFWLPSVTVV